MSEVSTVPRKIVRLIECSDYSIRFFSLNVPKETDKKTSKQKQLQWKITCSYYYNIWNL